MSQADVDEQTADEHDSEECACGACERTRERDASRVRAREASVRGGLIPAARELFGGRLIDVFERGAQMEVAELAQHALGNIFEELEKLGCGLRVKLHGERYTATMPSGVNRVDVATALNYAESLIEFARAQLGYMPELPFKLNSPIAMVDRAGAETLGVFCGVSKAGNARVRVENSNGENGRDEPAYYEVPFSHVRAVAV